MTDTAGLFKPLVWEDFGREVYSENKLYQISKYTGAGEWITLGQIFENLEKAKAACQTDYETRILSTLNLDAFKARIRAEALEEAVGLLRKIANNSHASGEPGIKCDTYRRAANILSKKAHSKKPASIRALKEGE